MAENEVLFTAMREEREEQTFLGQESHGNMHPSQADASTETDDISVAIDTSHGDHDDTADEDEFGRYVELFFTDDIAKVILEEDQFVQPGDVATLRVYISDIRR